jgi:TRAP-type C4-dicarboxylate transport system permease large subunit
MNTDLFVAGFVVGLITTPFIILIVFWILYELRERRNIAESKKEGVK